MGYGSRLTKTETKLISGLNIVLVKSAVVNEESLGEPVIAVDDIGTVVALLLRDSVRKLAIGGSGAVKHINKAISALLTGKASPNNSQNVCVGKNTLENYGSNAVNNDNHLLVHLGNCSDKVVTLVPRIQIWPVTTDTFDFDVALTRIGVDEN